MIIGVVGPIGSGKNVLVQTLIHKGYINLRVSNELKEEAKRRGIPWEREPAQDLGNELRKTRGPGYLAEKLVEKIEPGKNYVIDSIRNPGEIEVLRKVEGFVLIGFTAPLEKRLQWLLLRKKSGDPTTLEELRAMELRDRGYGEQEHGQQVDACFDAADIKIYNEGTLAELQGKIEVILKEISA